MSIHCKKTTQECLNIEHMKGKPPTCSSSPFNYRQGDVNIVYNDDLNSLNLKSPKFRAP